MTIGRAILVAAAGGLAWSGGADLHFPSMGGLMAPGAATLASRYDLGAVEGAEIVRTVTATGSVASTINVEVGAQLSGQIVKLAADFNDPVRKGQVLAEIEDSSFRAQVEQARAAFEGAGADVRVAEAKLARAMADEAQIVTQRSVLSARLDAARGAATIARREAERKSALLAKSVIAASDADDAASRAGMAAANEREAEANLAALAAQSQGAKADIARASAEADSARAAVRRAAAQLENASIDLQHTRIRSPIDGVVIGRGVEEGQTLASTLETRTLFVIAGDLRRMEIRARVDESDIAQVRIGEPVTFTVDAYPERRFAATVSQIRKDPMVIQNVVTYIVVLAAANDDYALLPGMTVVAKIETERAVASRTVPLAALRFHPRGPTSAAEPKGSVVWTLKDGAPTPVAVTIGNDDGERAAVTSGDLAPGEQVLTGEAPPGPAPVRPRGDG
ncbi:HlyD family secretion protein [Roseiarcus fermentans]|uniref:HlyD family secretion protein n=1 Tax=Roseiarcus fermentans TaxID=1473586 RepID=A0A366FWJ6_9HYPH|nr:efflux RND transporter periplasmic adaptor subunit [Roseiarcus fermentans]RBP18400.1 HlyD family secretion protein [Roseiarcus fermentans]